MSQGDFLKELRECRSQAASPRQRFEWDRTLAEARRDSRQPPMKLAEIATTAANAGVPTPAPTADLPRRLDGQLDNSALRDDLVTQMRTSRRRGAR